MYDYIATVIGGRNRDRWTIGPGQTRVLADSEDPGVRCVPTGALDA